MVVRKLAGLVLAAGVLVSVAGCSFNPTPDTLQSYAPSDGVGADITFKKDSNEDVKFRNFLVVTDGTSSALFGTVINAGDKPEDITIQLASDHSQSENFRIEAGQTIVFNADNKSTLQLEGKAGSVIELSVGPKSGNAWQNLEVPVLDGAIDYYQNLLTPSPAATN